MNCQQVRRHHNNHNELSACTLHNNFTDKQFVCKFVWNRLGNDHKKLSASTFTILQTNAKSTWHVYVYIYVHTYTYKALGWHPPFLEPWPITPWSLCGRPVPFSGWKPNEVKQTIPKDHEDNGILQWFCQRTLVYACIVVNQNSFCAGALSVDFHVSVKEHKFFAVEEKEISLLMETHNSLIEFYWLLIETLSLSFTWNRPSQSEKEVKFRFHDCVPNDLAMSTAYQGSLLGSYLVHRPMKPSRAPR